MDIDSSEVSSQLFRYLSSDILQDQQAQVHEDRPGLHVFGYVPTTSCRKPAWFNPHFITPETSYSDAEIVAQSMGRDEPPVFLEAETSACSRTSDCYSKPRSTPSSGPTPVQHPRCRRFSSPSSYSTPTARKRLIERLRQAVGTRS